MASTIKHQLAHSLSSVSSFDTKPRGLAREPLRRLKTIKEPEITQNPVPEVKQPSQTKLLRQKTGEFSSASPYASAVRFPLQRSKSFTRIRARTKIGKTASPEKHSNHKLGPLRTRGESLALTRSLLPSQFFNLRKKKSDVSVCSQSLFLSESIPEEDTYTQKMEVSLSDSFSQSLAGIPSLESPRHHRNVSFVSRLRDIKETMEKELLDVEDADTSDWRSEMQVYSKAFSEVIALGEQLGAVLDIIKGKYESWISNFADRLAREVAKSQAEIASLQTSLLKEIEEKKAMKRKFEKISRECVELNKSCELYQNKCFEYQEKLFDIANVKLSDYPPSESTWKLMLSELETYKTWKESAVKELRICQSKERKLLDLLHALKARGFPVEEVYNTDVKKPEKVPSTPSSASSESEPICSGPPAMRQRPAAVPVLRMDYVEPDMSSDGQSSSHFSTLHDSDNAFILEQSWSGKSRPTQETSGSNGPREKKTNQPMLGELSDISESWKRVLDERE